MNRTYWRVKIAQGLGWDDLLIGLACVSHIGKHHTLLPWSCPAVRLHHNKGRRQKMCHDESWLPLQ